MSRYFDSFESYLKPMPTLADTLRNRIADLEGRHTTLQEENTRLKSQNKTLQDEITSLKTNLNTYLRRDASHLATIESLGKSIKALDENILKKNREIDELKRKNTDLEASNRTLQKLVSKKNNEIDSLQSTNRNLADSNNFLQKLAYKPTTKPVTTDDLLKKLQNDKPKPNPKPEMSEEDKKTIARFKELMGDVNGCSGEEIVSRFLGTCLTMAMEDELKN